MFSTIYRKILKISPGDYKIFSKSLFEGLIFGGAYAWREICVSKLIGLMYWEGNLPFLLCFTLYSFYFVCNRFKNTFIPSMCTKFFGPVCT